MIYSFTSYRYRTFGYKAYNTRYNNNSGRLGEFIVYVAFSRVYFRRQKFSFQTYVVRKTNAENGVDLSDQFLERVSCL